MVSVLEAFSESGLMGRRPALARDNIFWAAIMLIVPAVAVYLHDQHHAYRLGLIRTALWLYAAVSLFI